MIDFPLIQSLRLVVAVSPDVPLDDSVLLIWGFFTRFDCWRDTFFQSVRIERGHPVYQGPLFIDASWKDGYPEPLEMTPDIIDKVNNRWKEYGIPMKDPGSPNKGVAPKELAHLS